MTIKEFPSLVGSIHGETLPQKTTRNLKSTGKSNYPSHKKGNSEGLSHSHQYIEDSSVHQISFRTIP